MIVSSRLALRSAVVSDIEQAAAEAAAWLAAQAGALPFGEVAVRLILHAGRISRIEKTITEKEQPHEGRDHEHTN